MPRLILLFIFFTNCLLVNAQGYLGINQSNYSGVTGLHLQPANVVDSRYKIDLQLFGINAMAYNNFMSISSADLKTLMKGQAGDDFFENNVQKRYNGKPKSVFLGTDVQGPSILITLSELDAISFTSRVRTFFNVDGVEDSLARLAVNDFDYQDYWIERISNKYLSVQTMAWAEYGVGYGRVLYDKNDHFIKAGGTLKLLQGLAAAHVQVEGLKYEFLNEDTLSLFESSVSYGHSNGFDPFNPAKPFQNYRFDSRPGLGLDLGVVYEWRPKGEPHRYEMDGRDNIWRADRNKYKLRAGFSVTDLGWIRYKKGAESGDFFADVALWDFRDLSATEMQHVNDTIFSRFNRLDSDKDFFRMTLPTAISTQIDYNIWRGFYVNFTSFWAIHYKKDPNKVHHFTNYSITPSFDTKWFGIATPLSYSNFTTFRAGVALRLGPLFVGTSDIRALTGGKSIYGADIFAAVKIPILNRIPKDKDGDKVSDRFDECKDTPGVWAFRGCPDSDGDGIQDTEDQCPMEPGLLEFGGCPDTDRDGIPDKDDDCPTIAGLKEFKGCPDSDGDGIPDKDDACPKLAGLPEFGGCPDTDGDGLPDHEDNCPTEYGPKENFGCPELIKLHLVDPLGNIITSVSPDEEGRFIFKNLPLERTYLFLFEGLDESELAAEIKIIVRNVDGDHVIVARLEDSGFFVYRHISVKIETPALELIELDEPHIVELTVEEIEIVKKAFDNLEFATGKAIIKQVSYDALNELAQLLEKHPEWKLDISGHTDNVGNASNNLMLSKKRAEAVKMFMVTHGISEDRLIVHYYGQTKPIADNTTEEGRQKNRRVEMKIVD